MVDSSLVGLYGGYLFNQFMYRMDSTLDIKMGGRKVEDYQGVNYQRTKTVIIQRCEIS